MDSFKDLNIWAYDHVSKHKNEFDLLREIQGFGQKVQADILAFRSKTSDVHEVASVDLIVMSYFTYATHTFLAARTLIEFGFPTVAEQAIRSLFESNIDLRYLLFGSNEDVLLKGQRYMEYQEAYAQHFSKKIMDQETLQQDDRFVRFEESLKSFKQKYGNGEDEKVRLDHWSGRNVRERCRDSGVEAHYFRYNWLSQSTHFTPVILSFFVRRTASGFEYLNGQTPEEFGGLVKKLGFEYYLTIAQVSEWYGLLETRQLLQAFDPKMLKFLQT